ncbi:MAG: HAMP domain-containing histidine kinase [Bauldia sp.]|nr:HAMP domain-containing histidine kinase [Bauldia sp.]
MNWLNALRGRVPITVKVPVVVVVLMVAIGAVASERVLARLVASQERQLGDLATAYLDGLATPLIEPVLREDSWEIFDILDRAHRPYAGARTVETVVTDSTGSVLAASNPRHAPIGSSLPADFPAGQEHMSTVLVREGDSRAFVDRRLVVEDRVIGTVHAELDISPLLAERRDVLWTLIGSNAAVTLLFAALGWFMVRRMVAPMKVLAEHIETAQDGAVEPIPEEAIPPAGTETGRLFRGFNRMARAVAEREALVARLADEERLASLGRLASSVAHEINNPLGGLFNAIDTLKVHGETVQVRRSAIDLLDRGLRGIRDVVRSALAAYRPDRETRNLQAADIDDLRLLVRPEARRRQIDLGWSNRLPAEAAVSAFPVRQVVLNLLLNGCRAAPEGGRVVLAACVVDDRLEVTVEDSGHGMPPHIAAFLAEEGSPAPIVEGTGLGLWVARKMAAELGGALTVGRSALGGAAVGVVVPLRRRSPELAHVA